MVSKDSFRLFTGFPIDLPLPPTGTREQEKSLSSLARYLTPGHAEQAEGYEGIRYHGYSEHVLISAVPAVLRGSGSGSPARIRGPGIPYSRNASEVVGVPP